MTQLRVLTGIVVLALVALWAASISRAVPGGRVSAEPALDNWQTEINTANAFFGYTVGSAGDVNGDGYDDVVVTASHEATSATYQGAVYVYHGAAAGPATTHNWRATGLDSWDLAGLTAESAGDVNNDGYDDLLVAGQGLFAVFLGSAAGLDNNPHWLVTAVLDVSFLGKVAAAAGDVNGDGYDDIIIGKRYNASIYYGSATGLDTTADWFVAAPQAGSQFGAAVSGAGDVNGDGYDDVMVAAPYYQNGQQFEGAVYVYFGSAAGPSIVADFITESNLTNAYLGNPLAPAGDINGDGYDDILLSAYPYSGSATAQGQVALYYGSAGGPGNPATWTRLGNGEGDFLGYSLGPAGDVNADGYADIVVSTPFMGHGRVFVLHGAPGGLGTEWDWDSSGQDYLARYGHSAQGAGDVNGDGYDDLAVGAPALTNGDFEEGRAYLYFGSAEGLTDPDPTPTPTATHTPTVTPSATPTGTPTATPTSTPTATPTATPSATPTATPTTTPGPEPDRLAYIPVIARPVLGAAALAAADGAAPQAAPTFVDVSVAYGLAQTSTDTYGVMLLDINGDGWQDAIYSNHGINPRVYLSNAGGSFTDVTNVSGIHLVTTRYVGELDRHGMSCADYDNDGDPDAFITRGANRTGALGVKIDELLRLGADDRFEFVDAQTSHAGNTWGAGRAATWVDYDRDGWLDLYVSNGEMVDVLYRNQGDGTFDDVTRAVALHPTLQHNTQVWGDFNNDGWPDLLLGGAELALFRNNGGVNFTPVTGSVGLIESGFTRTLGWGDYDGDGDMDIISSTLSAIKVWRYNSGTGTFSVVQSWADSAESVQFADIDNDGDLDVLAQIGDKVRHYENSAGTFGAPVTLATVQPGLALTDFAVVDINRDGALDIAAAGTGHYLFLNDGPVGNWLSLTLVGSAANAMGLGARVTVTLPDATTRIFDHLNSSGTRFTKSCTPLAVGVGGAALVDITVDWPSGAQTVLTGVAVNQHLTVNE